MKMFHPSHIVALTNRRANQAHRKDAKTMENLHRLRHDSQNYLKSTTMEKRWKFPIDCPSFIECKQKFRNPQSTMANR